MNNTEAIKIVGFSSLNEKNYLDRISPNFKRQSLEQELKTQLAEDFGLIEFTLKYKIQNGKIIDLISGGQELVELTSRRGVDEEVISIKKIENDLINNPEKTCIYFSPKNEKLGYPQNCVDFWRVVDDEVVWNRMVVKNSFEEMNRVRTFLSGEKEVNNEMEILKSPIAVDLKLVEIFNFFQLNESKNIYSFDYIERVVIKYLSEFEDGFGEKLTNSDDLIFRLYSACWKALKVIEKDEELIVDRGELKSYMYGTMNKVSVERSSGCAATTTIGSFGEKVGWYVLPSGEVVKGEIPDGYRYCEHCGCWYLGEKCPFC